MPALAIEDDEIIRVAFPFVRHNERNETVPRTMARETAAFEDMQAMSDAFGTTIRLEGDDAVVWQKS